VNGLIVISSRLHFHFESYLNDKPILLLPPTVNTYVEFKTVENYGKKNKLKLFYAGSPGGNKDDLGLFINGMALSENRFNIELHIVGLTQNDFTKLFNSYAKYLKLIDVFFYGRLSNIQTIQKLKDSHFQIIFRPTNRVTTFGFPYKLVESFQNLIPVIATNTSDISKYIKNNYNGFIVNYSSVDLGKLLDHLFERDYEINNFKKNISYDKDFYSSNFSISFNDFIKDVYNEN
jgi:glycosyltransferase involved in cell wall biosynthesis